MTGGRASYKVCSSEENRATEGEKRSQLLALCPVRRAEDCRGFRVPEASRDGCLSSLPFRNSTKVSGRSGASCVVTSTTELGATRRETPYPSADRPRAFGVEASLSPSNDR
jgi:hypothetical protein